MNSKKNDISLTDAKYLGINLREHLYGAVKGTFAGEPKFSFPCPFCSHLRKKDYKKTARCAGLYWVEKRGCYRFGCRNRGSVICRDTLEYPRFLQELDKNLFREYQLERFHEGTTGGRWNCPHPPGIEITRNSESVTKGHPGNSRQKPRKRPLRTDQPTTPEEH